MLIHRSGQNHIHTVYIWCFLQGLNFIKIRSHTVVICNYTVLAKPDYIFTQGCVIRSFGTFNTVKYALNTEYALRI